MNAINGKKGMGVSQWKKYCNPGYYGFGLIGGNGKIRYSAAV